MRFVGKIGRSIQAYVARCAALEPVWAISIMTLLAMVRYQGGAWYYHIIGPVILGVATLFPKIVYREQFWLMLCMITGSSIVLDWTLLGNHSFMQFYWNLALLLACFSSNRLRFLAKSARWLVAFLFLFAFIWKLNSSDFRSGATARYLLSATFPAGQVSVMLAGLNPSALADNISIVEHVLSSSVNTKAKLHSSDGVGRLADVVTMMTIASEGLIALVFLLPLTSKWKWLRDLTLIFFMLTAYTIIPVASFGTQLAYLGYAATDSKWSRATFITLFFMHQLSGLFLGSA
jgi:hypothetical protein